MKDSECVTFLQWLLPQLQMRWPGFRKVRRQVCRRVNRRIVELGLPNKVAYQDWIVAHPDELKILDSFCRITISRFYRDRGVFDQLRNCVLLEIAKSARANGRRDVRCWSAGCASGEEPYTLNILWKQYVSPRVAEVEVKIAATDCHPQMLERARRGSYSSSSLKDLPREWMRDCFSHEDGEYSLLPEFRAGIEWHQQDIRSEMPCGEFDLILCRHLVFTYFDETLQNKLLDELIAHLRPGGYLVTGKQESLPTTTGDLTELQPPMGIYRKPT